MQPRQKSPRSTKTQKRQNAKGAAVRRARKRQTSSAAEAVPAKKGGISTGLFIVTAAAIGAVIAWAAMTFLA